MKKKWVVLLLVMVFLLSNTMAAYAKGFSGGRTGGFRSGGFSGSSKRSTGIFGSSSSSKTGSTSRSVPSGGTTGSGYGGSSTSKSGTGSLFSGSSKTSTAKSAYMQNTYKKQVSSQNYAKFNQTLNSDQQKAYSSGMNRGYSYGKTMDFDYAMRTRNSRMGYYGKRPIYVNVNTGMFGGPFGWGSGFVGVWDLWFLMRASDMFFYHHWNDISPYKSYFQQQEIDRLEDRVRQLENQGVVRDPNYLEPGVDPDLQFSKEYQEKNLNKMYYTNKNPQGANPIVIILILVGVSVVVILLIKKYAKPKPKKAFSSSIY